MSPQRSRPGRTILPAKKRQEPFFGRYSSDITRREPRRFSRLKHPLEQYKDVPDIQRILREYYTGPIYETNNLNRVFTDKTLKSIFEESIIDFKRKYNSEFGNNPFKSNGENTHIILPLTGMSPIGFFYKGLFEQLMPKARITFLITPKSQSNMMKGTYDLSKFKDQLKKSLNKNDKYFVIFDYIKNGHTVYNIFSEIKNLIPKEQFNSISINTNYEPFEEHRNYLKQVNLSKQRSELRVLPKSEVLRNPRTIVKGNSYDFGEPSKQYRIQNPLLTEKEYKQQKRLEQAREYTYYWLGKEFANNPKNKAFFE